MAVAAGDDASAPLLVDGGLPMLKLTGGHPGPYVAVLGSIEVRGAQWRLTPQQLSFVALLACERGAGRETIVDALWDGRPISGGRLANLATDVRAKIGRDHLPEAVDGRYRLVGVPTDLDLFEGLVTSAARIGGGMSRRSAALALVRGAPFTPPVRRYWSWVADRGNLAARAEALVADAARELAAELAARGDLDAARRACEQGLLASPLDEALVLALARIYVDLGKAGSANRLIAGFEGKLRRLELTVPAPSTVRTALVPAR